MAGLPQGPQRALDRCRVGREGRAGVDVQEGRAHGKRHPEEPYPSDGMCRGGPGFPKGCYILFGDPFGDRPGWAEPSDDLEALCPGPLWP
jgi:hypothetical protein